MVNWTSVAFKQIGKLVPHDRAALFPWSIQSLAISAYWNYAQRAFKNQIFHVANNLQVA